MTKSLVPLACALLVAAVAVLSAPVPQSVMSPVPIALWSPSMPLLDHVRVQADSGTSVRDVEAAIAQLVSGESTAAAASPRPRALVAFVVPQMTAADFAAASGLGWVKSSIRSAASSVLLSNVHTQGVQISQDLGSVVSPHARVAQLQWAACEAEQLEQLPSSGEPLVAVVRVSEAFGKDVRALDACMERVSAGVERATEGSYVLAFASDSAPPVQLSFGAEGGEADGAAVFALLEEGAEALLGDAAPTGVQYITSNILFGLFFGFMFLFTLLCGLSCLMSIDTPLRFASEKLPVNKEF